MKEFAPFMSSWDYFTMEQKQFWQNYLAWKYISFL